MTDRIKVGDVFLELPKGTIKPSVPVMAEKSDVPEALEVPVFTRPRNDAVQDYIAKIAAPSAQSAAEQAQEKQPDQMDEWVSFCGGDTATPQRWLHYQEKTARNCGFNGFACLFGVQWFFYHRMYVNGLLSLVCELVPALGFIAVMSSVASRSHAMGNIVALAALAMFLGARVLVANWANVARYRRALREIEKTRALNFKPAMHLSVIRSAGATSFASVFLLYAAMAALRALMIAVS